MAHRRWFPWLGLLVVAIVAVVLGTRRWAREPAPLAAPAPREAPRSLAGEAAPSTAAPVAAAAPSARQETGPARPAAPARRWVKAGWGSGRGQLGRVEPREGNPEGPTAVAPDGRGRVLVLDRVNGRVVTYDERGQVLGEVPTAVRSPQELLPTRDGHLLVLDRTADRAVAVHDADGKLVGELPIEGRGVEDGGEVTGLFVDGDSVYVETGHSELVRIGNTAGQPDAERSTLAGRPTRDGRALLRAELVDARRGLLRVRILDRRTGEERLARVVDVATPFFSILQLDSDLSGRIFVAVHAGRESSPGVVVGEEVRVACFGPSLEPRGLARLPANVLPDESFRDLAVADDGTLVYMHRTEAGVAIETYTCGP